MAGGLRRRCYSDQRRRYSDQRRRALIAIIGVLSTKAYSASTKVPDGYTNVASMAAGGSCTVEQANLPVHHRRRRFYATEQLGMHPTPSCKGSIDGLYDDTVSYADKSGSGTNTIGASYLFDNGITRVTWMKITFKQAYSIQYFGMEQRPSTTERWSSLKLTFSSGA